MKMIIRRLLSNIIDLLIFILIFVILFKLSGVNTDANQLYYFYFVSFILSFIFPVLTINNTIGKTIVKLEWNNIKFLKEKLIGKYIFYYLLFAPSFSITSAIISFPLFHSNLAQYEKLISLKVFFVFIISDILIFIFSLGKYHQIDYLLNLSLKTYQYVKKPFKYLSITYLFFSLLIIANFVTYKYNFSFPSFENEFNTRYIKEHYPSDLYCGSSVFTLRDKSENVFTPSKPLTFIYSQELEQKTIYIDLPKEIFNSENERKRICYDLIYQSNLNNIFFNYQPSQTKIVLSNIERGVFLEYYNYFYIYYFDNNLPEWLVYGGIKADSITMKNYINFNYHYNQAIYEKIKSLEQKHKLSYSEIVEKAKKDINLEKEIANFLNSSFVSSCYPNHLEIKIDTIKLNLYRIKFSDTKLNGYIGYNFPITELEQRVLLTNFINGEIIEYDENVDYLKLLRKEVTNEGI